MIAANSSLDFFAPQYPLTPSEQVSGIHRHHWVLTFHIIWKVAAILTYVFGNLLKYLLKSEDMVPTIFAIIFLVLDFWTTKNVSGRLLAGLRWWNQIQPDGSSHWNFESFQDKTLINPYENKLFWTMLIISPIIWIIFTIQCILGFLNNKIWLAVCILALVLQCSNLIGYFQCAKDARKKISSYATKTIIERFVQNTVD